MDDPEPSNEGGRSGLRRGWTTGACATAAAKAAASALVSGAFPDPVTITLPRGQQPAFALAMHKHGPGFAEAGVIKDAGDDPDVTHGALVMARVEPAERRDIVFRAGEGVGTVTLPGLPLTVGEPAINPVPRQMIENALAEVAPERGFNVTISIPGGEEIAKKTWNGRLGIVGGLSVLGTTGIVVPYSCSAWIHSIQRGVDVARAAGLTHLVGATGDTSERAARRHLRLPELAFIDMGDFAGGFLKYCRDHPVANVTVAGGFAKLSKLAAGRLDLHSRRGSVDMHFLAELAKSAGADPQTCTAIATAPSAANALAAAQAARCDLANAVASAAQAVGAETLAPADANMHIVLCDRSGRILSEA